MVTIVAALALAATTGRTVEPVATTGRHIVRFDSAAPASVSTSALRSVPGGRLRVTHTFTGSLVNGFAAELDAETAAYFRRMNASVVEEQVYTAQTLEYLDLSWGLDRIDQADLPLDSTADWTNQAADAHVFILDTGINAAHNEFTGRVGDGFDSIGDDLDPDDRDGHGTHCAGTAAGTTYGVAKAATVHGVRVLNEEGSGTTTSVVAGMEWVRSHPAAIKVASMSLGGGADPTLDAAVKALHSAGTTVVVAAGNSAADACSFSPARAPEAITVGATTEADQAAYFSNAGSCVDILAPGNRIWSAYIGAPDAVQRLSGTSMACPHVAGVVAQIATRLGASATPAQVKTELLNLAVSNTITDSGIVPGRNVPNVFLQADPTVYSAPPPSPPSPPGPPPSPPPPPGRPITVRIDPDSWPAEISWKLYFRQGSSWELLREYHVHPCDVPTSFVDVLAEAGEFELQVFDDYGDGFNGYYGVYLGSEEVFRFSGLTLTDGLFASELFSVGVASPPPVTPRPPPAAPSSPPPPPHPPAPPPPPGEPLFITVTTDDQPEETQWKLFRRTTSDRYEYVTASAWPITSSGVPVTWTVHLQRTDVYRWQLEDSAGNGIGGNGGYELSLDGYIAAAADGSSFASSVEVELDVAKLIDERESQSSSSSTTDGTVGNTTTAAPTLEEFINSLDETTLTYVGAGVGGMFLVVAGACLIALYNQRKKRIDLEERRRSGRAKSVTGSETSRTNRTARSYRAQSTTRSHAPRGGGRGGSRPPTGALGPPQHATHGETDRTLYA